jgi:hypothetical protein
MRRVDPPDYDVGWRRVADGAVGCSDKYGSVYLDRNRHPSIKTSIDRNRPVHTTISGSGNSGNIF